MKSRVLAGLICALLLGATADCSLVASSELKAGIGEACTTDSACQGGVCNAGVCSHACVSNEGCPSPSICILGMCGVGCTADTSCGTTQICEKNACIAGCRKDETCGSGQVCVDLACKVGCREDANCPTSGDICNANACVPGCRADAVCGSAKICESLACVDGCRDTSTCPSGTICEAKLCVAGCVTDATCGTGKICEEKACKPGCRNDQGCTTDNYCDTAVLACKPTLKVAAVLPGATNGQDGWSTSHKLGLDTVSVNYVHFGTKNYELLDGVRTTADATNAIAQFVAQGAKVIITASQGANDELINQAPKYPNVKFVAAGARKNGSLENLGAYSAKAEQLWFATGKLSAREADSGKKCVGLILPTANRATVREANAFARGVRKFDPAIKVVIRWVGASKDFSDTPKYSYKATNYNFDTANDGKLFREELLAAQLADLGCTLVAHRTETQRTVAFIENKLAARVNASKPAGNKNLFSLGVDLRDACRANGTWMPSCLGAPYWNWGPLYAKLFDQMNRDVWKGQVVREDFQIGPSALMKFELSALSAVTGVSSDEADKLLSDAADAGYDEVFRGPYDFNGQRDLDKNGVPDANQSLGGAFPLSDEELDRMCWFVEGVYELPNPNVVSYATLIPAMVPYGPPVSGQVITMIPTDTASKDKYGDVISYVQSLGQDPQQTMSCPLN